MYGDVWTTVTSVRENKSSIIWESPKAVPSATETEPRAVSSERARSASHARALPGDKSATAMVEMGVPS